MQMITGEEQMAPNGAKVMDSDLLPVPYNPSWAYLCSLRDWIKIRDILGGADQMRGKRSEIWGAGSSSPSSGNAAQSKRFENPYIQRYALEGDYDYERRVRHAPFENHFFDALDAVCDKPFTKPVQLRGDTPDELIDFSNDVDGQGTSIHEFGRSVFKEGAAFGVSGVFVDYPTLHEGATLADQRNMKARPYWIEVVAEDLLVYRKASLNGKQFITELRFVERREDYTGSILSLLRTVRTYRHDGKGPVEFEIWQEQSDASWLNVSTGTLKGVKAIPFKDFFTGRRDRLTGRTISPMLALADLQIEHFQQNTNLKHILDMTAFPMLCGAGINPQLDQSGEPVSIQMGPSAILYAPAMTGTTGKPPEWKYLEPTGSSVKLLMENLDRIVAAIDKLGKAPLIKSTGRVTATSDAISAAKGHATAEVWAELLGKTLSAAFDFTAEYMGLTLTGPVQVEINTEFGIEDGNIADGTELRNMTMAGLLSKQTYWAELRRRAILSSAFDPDKEAILIKSDDADKLEKQKSQLELSAAFGAKAQEEGTASTTPPPGAKLGPENDAGYTRKQSGSNLSVN